VVCDPCPLLRDFDFFPKLLLGYSFAVFAAHSTSHPLYTALLPYFRQQQYPCSRCGWRVYAVHPSTRLGPCICGFCLGDEAKRGAVFGVTMHQCSVSIGALVFPIGKKREVNPHVISLHRKYASFFPPTGTHDVSTFLSQNNHKLYFFLRELFMNRLAVAHLD